MTVLVAAWLSMLQDPAQELTGLVESTIEAGAFQIEGRFDMTQSVREGTVEISVVSAGTWEGPGTSHEQLTIVNRGAAQPVESQTEVFRRGARTWVRSGDDAGWSEMEKPSFGNSVDADMMTNPVWSFQRLILEAGVDVQRLEDQEIDGVIYEVYEMTLSGERVGRSMLPSLQREGRLVLDEDASSLRIRFSAGAEDRRIRRITMEGQVQVSLDGATYRTEIDGSFTLGEFGTARVEAPTDLPE